MKHISIRKASEHNLKSIDLEIPRDALVVFTGVSGSGKSSLAYDTIYRESERRYLRTLSSYARQFLGKLGRPAVERIDGLSPAVAVDQRTVVRNPRSTVATMSEIHDHLRLLFSRLGDCPAGENSSLFSFNSPSGACPKCKGLGVMDRIDPDLLVEDPEKTIREGALVITNPTGYLMYSQVTLDVLNTVCEAHGFNVDIPWKDLTESQLKVVLGGSKRVKILYGKHPLESRMKWSGITAKPREEGYYKGILPVMEQILNRDRNKNIMRFARTLRCSSCDGARLNDRALGVFVHEKNMAQVCAMTVGDLGRWFEGLQFAGANREVGSSIGKQILERVEILANLGLAYLALDRESTTLSGGEAQRIRLANQVGSRLQGILYVLDEPSVGLHPRDNGRLLDILRRLRDNGNTVLVVEHDAETIRAADWLVDLGPGAGDEGGELLYSGPPEMADSSSCSSLLERVTVPETRRDGVGLLQLKGAAQHNLADVDAVFRVGAFNVVTGVSGAGKSTLVNNILARAAARALHGRNLQPGAHRELLGLELLDKLIEIDQAPIGRTPRSNPATYTKLFDLIRDLFARQPESESRGFDKGRFSFNVKGGRCEACQGAGILQVGMHFLASVAVVCDECEGRRFNDETLKIEYRGKDIHDVLEMSVREAARFFADQPKISRILNAMLGVGLGYVALGQPSTTLSGGEAQRVKLSAELARPATGKTLYVLDEPTTGLHAADVAVLVRALDRLVDAGNTVVAIEHNLDFIKVADWVVDLGPDSGARGGKIVAMGTPEDVSSVAASLIGAYLKLELAGAEYPAPEPPPTRTDRGMSCIELRGVNTNNLRDVNLDIPHNKLTVVTGVSGSGKSSLAFDTVYAEGRRRFSESLSAHARRYFKQLPEPDAHSIKGMGSAIAIGQNVASDNPRSIVATLCEVHDLYRLIYSRAGVSDTGDSPSMLARDFSFNHHSGSCDRCRGLGLVTVCSPDSLVSDPCKSLMDGAMDGSKTGRFYGERGGQYLAILEAVGSCEGIDFSVPFDALPPEAVQIAMGGTGNQEYDVKWRFDRKGRVGEHNFRSVWLGFCGLVEEEYARVHADHRGGQMRVVMVDDVCPGCGGRRLKESVLRVRFANHSIAELIELSAAESIALLEKIQASPEAFGVDAKQAQITAEARLEVITRLRPVVEVGLGYLCLDRPISTLSGGEQGRLRLAAQLGSGLCRVTYVLDEPTVGLHPRDTGRLITMLERLRDGGNTVVVVEHDEKMIRAADFIVDMGPGAGDLGGEVVATGSVEEVKNNPRSLTGTYLSGAGKPLPSRIPRKLRSGFLIAGAVAHNLKGETVNIPTGGVVAITGVSGSGKSSLVFDVLCASVKRGRPVCCERVDGLQDVARVIAVDQSPIGLTPASNPATYVGVFDTIRDLFARTEDARLRGFKKGWFSFNSKGGRCEACAGLGQTRVEMGFLADIWIPCDECSGTRYRADVLDVSYRGRSVAEVLAMTIGEALKFFYGEAKVVRSLEMLVRVGLGYLTLGQACNTLSGGEAQRLKLASELLPQKKASGNTGGNLYVFDEPTTGLHFQDVHRLVELFDELADAGHTVLVVEHNLDVIRRADWVIDLGPEGGEGGGRIVAEGTPADVAECEGAWTGQALRG